MGFFELKNKEGWRGSFDLSQNYLQIFSQVFISKAIIFIKLHNYFPHKHS